MNKMDTAIIEECVTRTRELIEADWAEIASMKDENDGRLKVSVAFLIAFKGNEQSVKTTLTYGRRVTDSRETVINPDQMTFDELAEPPSAGTSEGNGQVDAPEKKSKRVRGRAKDAQQAE